MSRWGADGSYSSEIVKFRSPFFKFQRPNNTKKIVQGLGIWALWEPSSFKKVAPWHRIYIVFTIAFHRVRQGFKLFIWRIGTIFDMFYISSLAFREYGLEFKFILFFIMPMRMNEFSCHIKMSLVNTYLYPEKTVRKYGQKYIISSTRT